MALNQSDIDKIAELARLKPTKEEKNKLLADLNKILGYMEIIDEIEVDKKAGTRLSKSKSTPMRKDKPKRGLSSEKALSNAPQTKKDLFIVPKIIDNTGNTSR